MSVTVYGRFGSNERGVMGYVDRMRVKYTTKWDMQMAGMNFQTCSSITHASYHYVSRRMTSTSPLCEITIREKNETVETRNQNMKIAVAGTGYVGLSLAVLLSKHNEVTAVDIVPEKVEKLNR